MAITACVSVGGHSTAEPPPPTPEPVVVRALPLPPTSPSTIAGSCTPAVNPHATGCIGIADGFQSGDFLPDGRHVLALVQFVGAGTPSSVYSGAQMIIVTTDGTTFANGDAWKCLTCGMPVENAVGIDNTRDYPQAFRDGKRLLAGTNVFDCSPFLLTDDDCTAKRMHAYPIRFNVTADGSNAGGTIRELRLHPDGIHLGFNAFVTANGKLDQFGYLATLTFNPTPKTGLPLAPRYDLAKVTVLFKEGMNARVLKVNPQNPKELLIDTQGIEVGELRGFSGDGAEVTYIGFSHEASNIDVFAANLATGKVRRLTSHPEYTDPLGYSPDNKWFVVADTRGSNRQMFAAGMRWIPPVTDLLTSSAVSSIRNNGQRRFFQPYLIDRYGDRGAYFGQQLNAGEGSPGSVSDPNWNAMADPRWSPDSTGVVYWQAQVVSPACGDGNPLPCPVSTEPGGRRYRLMMAQLTSRKPVAMIQPAAISDTVPWGTPYVVGSATPSRTLIPAGTYTLRGKISGQAEVVITHSADDTAIDTVAVSYNNYSDVAGYIINGTERVTGKHPDSYTSQLEWHSNLVQSGKVHGTKISSPDGFNLTINVMQNIFQATGSLTTTLDNKVYRQPEGGT